MHDVKYRGKSKYEDTWYYGSLINNILYLRESMAPILYILDTDAFEYDSFLDIAEHLDYCEVVAESVGHYTGFKDKNKQEIYLGDVIEGLMDFGPAGYHTVIVPVKYDKARGHMLHYFKLDEVEVVGNVYENPELLEKKERTL